MNNKPHTGGPAFPVVDYTQPDGRGNHIMTITGGMTLRDYFAAKAMQGLLAAWIHGVPDDKTITAAAYKYADAMLKARGQ